MTGGLGFGAYGIEIAASLRQAQDRRLGASSQWQVEIEICDSCLPAGMVEIVWKLEIIHEIPASAGMTVVCFTYWDREPFSWVSLD